MGLLNSHPWVCRRRCWIWVFPTPPCRRDPYYCYCYNFWPLPIFLYKYISCQTKILFSTLKCHFSTSPQTKINNSTWFMQHFSRRVVLEGSHLNLNTFKYVFVANRLIKKSLKQTIFENVEILTIFYHMLRICQGSFCTIHLNFWHFWKILKTLVFKGFVKFYIFAIF